MVSPDLQQRIERFLYDYADCLDAERFAEFPSFFDEAGCEYLVLSRENLDQGLPLPIMSAFSLTAVSRIRSAGTITPRSITL